MQRRKILLLRSFLANKKRQRKIYSARTVVKKFFVVELKFYNQLQKAFDQVKLLIHHDFTRITYVNVDVFKRRDFDVVIYHLKSDADFNNFKIDEIELIMFFSRILISVEKRY